MKFSLGLCSVSFRENTPKEIIKAAKAAGLDFIEWGSDVHAPCTDTKKLTEIAALQEEYGIRCSSYGTYFRLGVTSADELSDYINAAKILGTSVLRVWCGDKNSEEYTDGERDALISACRAAADIAKINGAVLCTECHERTYTNTKESALELMLAVGSDSFRTYWQPNQYKSKQENIDYARLLAPYTLNLHVFNWKGDEKFVLREAADVWKEYLSCFQGERALLLEFMPDGNIASLKAEAEALKEIVK